LYDHRLPPERPDGKEYGLDIIGGCWYLRERFLSLRFLPDTAAIIEACCRAWNTLIAEPGRIRSLCAYPWITKLAS